MGGGLRGGWRVYGCSGVEGGLAGLCRPQPLIEASQVAVQCTLPRASRCSPAEL